MWIANGALRGAIKCSQAYEFFRRSKESNYELLGLSIVKNIIFLMIDTLRYDRLGVSGNQPDLTPTLNWLARNGIWVDRVMAALLFGVAIFLIASATPFEIR